MVQPVCSVRNAPGVAPVWWAKYLPKLVGSAKPNRRAIADTESSVCARRRVASRKIRSSMTCLAVWPGRGPAGPVDGLGRVVDEHYGVLDVVQVGEVAFQLLTEQAVDRVLRRLGGVVRGLGECGQAVVRGRRPGRPPRRRRDHRGHRRGARPGRDHRPVTVTAGSWRRSGCGSRQCPETPGMATPCHGDANVSVARLAVGDAGHHWLGAGHASDLTSCLAIAPMTRQVSQKVRARMPARSHRFGRTLGAFTRRALWPSFIIGDQLSETYISAGHVTWAHPTICPCNVAKSKVDLSA